MMTSLRCFARLSLLVILAASVAPGAWASNTNHPQIPNDSIEVGPEHEATTRAYDSPAMVPAAAFLNDGGDPDGHFFSFGNGAIYVDTGAFSCMYAPVHIPSGATITSFYVNVVDNNDGLDVWVDLNRTYSYGSGSAMETIATVNSTGFDTNIDSLYTAAISQPGTGEYYNYYVTVCLYEDHVLYNARVYYSQP